MVKIATSSVDSLLTSKTGVLSSKLLGIPFALLDDVVELSLGWLDMFSFACYLSWLFFFCGPLWMAFGYGYLKMVKEERKWAKKYGYKWNEKTVVNQAEENGTDVEQF